MTKTKKPYRRIRVAIVGVGNCASSLVQGVGYVRRYGSEQAGLMRKSIGGITPDQVDFVAAFDIDARKVGKPLFEAIYAQPNNTRQLYMVPNDKGPIVMMGRVLDGVADHMHGGDEAFDVSTAKPVDVARELRRAKADVVLIYLPVGSEKAVRWYADQALRAGCALVNCIPVFLTKDAPLMERFKRRGLPVVGDDIKSQVGATIVHRTLARLFEVRGYRVTKTYQLNVGGNTDFLNMLERSRLASKKVSKTQSVKSQLPVSDLSPGNIHVGPSDYVPFLRDNKVAFIRLEGVGFCGAPIEIEARLSVQDSPNSAGVVIDALRYAFIARERKQGGPLYSACAACMKSPPKDNDRDDFELMREAGR